MLNTNTEIQSTVKIPLPDYIQQAFIKYSRVIQTALKTLLRLDKDALIFVRGGFLRDTLLDLEFKDIDCMIFTTLEFSAFRQAINHGEISDCLLPSKDHALIKIIKDNTFFDISVVTLLKVQPDLAEFYAKEASNKIGITINALFCRIVLDEEDELILDNKIYDFYGALAKAKKGVIEKHPSVTGYLQSRLTLDVKLLAFLAKAVKANRDLQLDEQLTAELMSVATYHKFGTFNPKEIFNEVYHAIAAGYGDIFVQQCEKYQFTSLLFVNYTQLNKEAKNFITVQLKQLGQYLLSLTNTEQYSIANYVISSIIILWPGVRYEYLQHLHKQPIDDYQTAKKLFFEISEAIFAKQKSIICLPGHQENLYKNIIAFLFYFEPIIHARFIDELHKEYKLSVSDDSISAKPAVDSIKQHYEIILSYKDKKYSETLIADNVIKITAPEIIDLIEESTKEEKNSLPVAESTQAVMQPIEKVISYKDALQKPKIELPDSNMVEMPKTTVSQKILNANIPNKSTGKTKKLSTNLVNVRHNKSEKVSIELVKCEVVIPSQRSDEKVSRITDGEQPGVIRTEKSAKAVHVSSSISAEVIKSKQQRKAKLTKPETEQAKIEKNTKTHTKSEQQSAKLLEDEITILATTNEAPKDNKPEIEIVNNIDNNKDKKTTYEKAQRFFSNIQDYFKKARKRPKSSYTKSSYALRKRAVETYKPPTQYEFNQRQQPEISPIDVLPQQTLFNKLTKLAMYDDPKKPVYTGFARVIRPAYFIGMVLVVLPTLIYMLNNEIITVEEAAERFLKFYLLFACADNGIFEIKSYLSEADNSLLAKLTAFKQYLPKYTNEDLIWPFMVIGAFIIAAKTFTDQELSSSDYLSFALVSVGLSIFRTSLRRRNERIVEDVVVEEETKGLRR